PSRMAGGFASTRRVSARFLTKRRLPKIGQGGSSSPSSMPFPRQRRSSFSLASAPTTRPKVAFHLLDALALCRFLPTQFRLDKHIDVPVNHGLHVARLSACTVVFDHLIRLKNVRSNLIPPRDLAFLAILPFHFRALFVLFELVQFCFQHLHCQLAVA